MAIFAIVAALILSLVLCASGVRLVYAFLLGCLVVPAFVLVSEFVVPCSGGGASMWPAALLFGGIYDAASSGAGVLAGHFIRNRRGANQRFIQDDVQTLPFNQPLLRDGGLTRRRPPMTRFLMFLLVALCGCTVRPRSVVIPEESVHLTGIVESVCKECKEAMILTDSGGSGLLWDVLTVRVTSPEAYSGVTVSVEVLLVDPIATQRLTYQEGNEIRFSVYKSAVEGLSFMVPAGSISVVK